jgi:hypothetical protein
MNVEEFRESFEAWYADHYTIRGGARGRASRHLTRYEGEYVSDHALECFTVWCAAMELKK